MESTSQRFTEKVCATNSIRKFHRFLSCTISATAAREQFSPKAACARMDLNGRRTIPDFMRGRRIRRMRDFLLRILYCSIFTTWAPEKACKSHSIGKAGFALTLLRLKTDSF